jgi:MYXO-CTERM domain-containing protein
MRKISWGHLVLPLVFASLCLTAKADDYAWAATYTPGTIYLVDASTGTVVGGKTITGAVSSRMFLANVDGSLYGAAISGSNVLLYSINTSTLVNGSYVATQVANLGSSVNGINGLTFDAGTGQLDLLTASNLYGINTSTFAINSLGTAKNQVGLAYDNGNLASLRYSPQPAQLVYLGQNGAVTETLSGSTIPNGSQQSSIFYGSDGTLFAADTSDRIYEYDDGSVSLVGTVSGMSGVFSSLASAAGSGNVYDVDLTVTPEPPTYLLGGGALLGLVLLGLRRRRAAVAV